MADLFDPDVLLCIWLAKDGQLQSWEIQPSIDRNGWSSRTGTAHHFVAGGLRSRPEALFMRTQFLLAIKDAERIGWTAIRPKR